MKRKRASRETEVETDEEEECRQRKKMKIPKKIVVSTIDAIDKTCNFVCCSVEFAERIDFEKYQNGSIKLDVFVENRDNCMAILSFKPLKIKEKVQGILVDLITIILSQDIDIFKKAIDYKKIKKEGQLKPFQVATCVRNLLSKETINKYMHERIKKLLDRNIDFYFRIKLRKENTGKWDHEEFEKHTLYLDSLFYHFEST